MQFSRLALLFVFVANVSAEMAHADARMVPTSQDLKSEVQAWLDADRAEFVGTIEFDKVMFMPADPARMNELQTVSEDRQLRTSKYIDQSRKLQADGDQELLEKVRQEHELTMQQMAGYEAWLMKWSRQGVRINQHWRVIYLDDENVRVEHALDNQFRPGQDAVRTIQVDGLSNATGWSWAGISAAEGERASALRQRADESIIRQGRNDLEYLTGHPAGVIRNYALIDVEVEGGKIIARLEKKNQLSGEVLTSTLLEFERRDDALVLTRCFGEGRTRFYRIWYGDHRLVNGEYVAFKKSYEIGPVEDRGIDVDDSQEIRRVVYTIEELTPGFSQERIELLEKPEGEDVTRLTARQVLGAK